VKRHHVFCYFRVGILAFGAFPRDILNQKMAENHSGPPSGKPGKKPDMKSGGITLF
jgi:hypothetical protein